MSTLGEKVESSSNALVPIANRLGLSCRSRSWTCAHLVTLTLVVNWLITPAMGDEPIRLAATQSKFQVSIALPTLEVRKLGTKPPKKLATVLLSMHLNDEGKMGPAIFGSYSVENDRLIFTPRFRLTPGASYEIRARVKRREVKREYQVPKGPSIASAEVIRIAPSTNRLPANHMKFYIYFSQPMREGRQVFDSLQLMDEQGEVAKDPWRRVDLWDAERKRLTLWIHPGRIKQGLNLREDYGPVLVKGKKYALRVLTTFKDKTGNPLKKVYSKEFVVIPAIHRQVLPQTWRLTSPAQGTRHPLIVEFDRSMDPVLCKRMLTVYDRSGKSVPGKLVTTTKEAGCRFIPEKPWGLGKYELRVHSQLEDLAGNTPLRIFDTDLETSKLVNAKLRLKFETKKKTEDADTSAN